MIKTKKSSKDIRIAQLQGNWRRGIYIVREIFECYSNIISINYADE
jgi:hypothetical protein